MKKLNAAYLWLTNLGITPGLKIEEAQRVRLTNILATSPSFIYIIFTWYSLYAHFYFLTLLCVILAAGMVTGLYFSYKGRPGVTKSLILILNSLIIFAGYNSMNIDYSIVSYYFAVIIAYMMVYDIKKERRGFFPTFLFTLACIACCFLLPKYLFCTALLPADLLKTFIVMNNVFSLGLSIVFMFIIIDMQAKTQDKLIKARENS
jgi:hypothetical protein